MRTLLPRVQSNPGLEFANAFGVLSAASRPASHWLKEQLSRLHPDTALCVEMIADYHGLRLSQETSSSILIVIAA